MAAGVASGLQNRFGVREVSRVGSIPTRSRQQRVRFYVSGMRSCLVVLLLVAAPAGVRAQETDPPAPASLDSAQASAPVSSSVQAVGADSVEVRPPVTPMGAFFRSLVLPGWGQVAADQPGRGAFYFAAEAGSLWMLFKTNAKLKAAKSATPYDQETVDLREAQVEDWATLAVFWALFAGVDAWVSAQLWDFTGEIVPPPDGSPGAAFRYSVPVGP